MTDLTFPPVDDAAWRARVEAELGEADFSTLTTELLEGIPCEPLHTRHDASSRQPRAHIDSALGWHLTPRLDIAEPADASRQIVDDRAGGATAFWLRLDRAARSGLDADGRAEGSLAGRDGVAAYHAGDLRDALSGANLTGAALLIDAGANTLPMAAALVSFMEDAGIDPAACELHLGCDPAGALAADGTLPTTITRLADELAQLVGWCEGAHPASTAVVVSDLPYHEAGATAVEELGMAASALASYLRWLDAAGHAPEVGLRRIVLRSAVDRDLFLGIAKLRALRTLWHKIAGACGVAAPPAARVHAVTAERSLTRRAPWVNMLRATGQTFAAVLGGADFITTAAWDRPLGRSTGDARRLARNTQTILGEESALGRVLDPAGGAHYIEQLTDRLARRAWASFQEIEGQGGALKVLGSGWFAARLSEARARRREALADGRMGLTGVTDYVDDGEQLPERELFDAEFASDRALARLQSHRDQRLEAPDPDRDCADFEELVRLAGIGATLGEMSRALRRPPGDRADALPVYRDEEAAE